MSSSPITQTKSPMIFRVALLIVGIIIISALLLFPQYETVDSVEVDETTRYSYSSDSIDTSSEAALSRFQLDFNLHSTDNSTLYVRMIIARGERIEIFRTHAGTAFDDKVPITVGYRYEVEVANDDEGHYNPLQGWIDPIEISITGSFSLQRKPLYYDMLMSFGAIMLAGGLLIYIRTDHKAHARVEK